MDLKLKDKVVAITGGGGGIGSALINTFLEEGAIVVALDKDEEKGEKIKEQIEERSNRMLYMVVDVADSLAIEKAFNTIEERFSGLDILVNNAGVFSCTPILNITPSSWDETMKVNLRSVMCCSQQAIRIMQKKGSGRIINIASMGGQTGGIFAGADYSASKAGIISLTKSFAKNFGKFGITVNCVNPGPLETDMTKEWPEEVLNGLRQSMLIRQDRLGLPEEVANVVVFLSSERAALIHGAQIDANGGIHIG